MKPRLLVLSPYLPFPLNSGGNSAQFRLLKHLINYCDITICTEGTSQNLKGLSGLQSHFPTIQFLIVPQPYFKRKYLQLKSIIWRFLVPLLARLLKSTNSTNSYQNQIDKAINTSISNELLTFLSCQDLSLFDCIQVEFYEYLTAITTLSKHPNVVFIHHEVRFEVIGKLAMAQEVGNAAFTSINAIALHEIALLNKYRQIVVFSESDKDILVSNGLTSQAHVIPIPYLGPSCTVDKKHKEPPQLIFLGGYNHFPNFDGLIYFHKSIWPFVKQHFPHLQLTVIGNWPKSIRNAIHCDSDFTFLGFIDSLAEQLENSILIVPIRIGSGMRIKILDAVACGAAVISTPVGIDGIPLEHDSDCIIAETPNEFSQAIISLLNNPQIMASMANSAQRTLSEKLNANKIVQTRMALITNQAL